MPDDTTGIPAFFTVTATGFNAGQAVFVEICDGVSPATLNWSPAEHCDAASGQAPAFANGTGTVSFDAGETNRRLLPFKNSELIAFSPRVTNLTSTKKTTINR